MVEYAASRERVSELEGELKVAVEEEAETAQRLDAGASRVADRGEC